MSCPDTERIVELALSESVDPATQAHVRACPECRARLKLIAEARAAYEPDLAVPESLIQRTVDWVFVTERRGPKTAIDSRWPMAASFLLGAVTVLTAVVGTGSLGGGGTGPAIALALVAGAVAAVHEARQLRIGGAA